VWGGKSGGWRGKVGRGARAGGERGAEEEARAWVGERRKGGGLGKKRRGGKGERGGEKGGEEGYERGGGGGMGEQEGGGGGKVEGKEVSNGKVGERGGREAVWEIRGER